MKTFIVLCLCIAATQAFFFPKIKTVSNLDITKYTGRWYEVSVIITVILLPSGQNRQKTV